MPREITSATSLDNLRKEAKRWLKALRAGDAGRARHGFERAYPGAPREPGAARRAARAGARVRARELDRPEARARRQALSRRTARAAAARPPRRTSALAQDFVLAFDAHDEAALQRLNAHYERAFTFDDLWAEIWRRVYAFRQRSSRVPKNYLPLEEAQTAHRAGRRLRQLGRRCMRRRSPAARRRFRPYVDRRQREPHRAAASA